MRDRHFGISTHLFHEQTLDREHLVHVAAQGFEAIEVFATRSHFDYRDDAAVSRLAEWLSDTGLALHSMHAPIVEAMRGGQWVGSYSIASSDEARRRVAVAEIEAALAVATRVPYRYLVVHVGMPSAEKIPPGDNQPSAATRSLEAIVEAASRMNVRVALEVIPNALSAPATLVHLIEEQLEGLDVGICLDVGHANLLGDVGEAFETVSGHLWTTHVHDNHGARDEHLVPYAGTIDWDLAMMVSQKVGYDGVLMFEVANTGDPIDVLKRAVKARERLEKSLVVF
jgi:sugar phosphate isomerase/epimerase